MRNTNNAPTHGTETGPTARSHGAASLPARRPVVEFKAQRPAWLDWVEDIVGGGCLFATIIVLMFVIWGFSS